MPEASARIQQNSPLPARGRMTKGGRGFSVSGLLRRAMRVRVRVYVGAALAAMMTGIVVNALTLQHERHPSPFFAGSRRLATATTKTSLEPASPSAAAVPAPPAPPVRSAAVEPSVPAPVRPDAAEPPVSAPPEPPVRPARLGAVNESTAPQRTADPIADILRGGGNKDSQKLITAAQTALVKLGYPIKISGAPSADTAAALRDFEKAHGLPTSTEVTPRLLKLLGAAIVSAASR